MKTFPDFTWEWIIQSCESICNQLQDSKELSFLPERIQYYIKAAQGIIAIIPQLSEHPQLGKLVPMKSLMSLRWFPAKDREIVLDYDTNKSLYKINVIAIKSIEIESVVEEKSVLFDDVADELYAYITKLRVD